MTKKPMFDFKFHIKSENLQGNVIAPNARQARKQAQDLVAQGLDVIIPLKDITIGSKRPE